MKVALLGYGKMGKAIHHLLAERGHEVPFIIDWENTSDFQKSNPQNTDVAIDFSRPDAAFGNIQSALSRRIKIMSGTTGWLERMEDIKKTVEETEGTFFHASNFSLGVNLTFMFNQYAAKIMSAYPHYEISMEEIHHTEKLDRPSGTAITLAEDIIRNNPAKQRWTNEPSIDSEKIPIVSKRLPNVPGTHTVTYTSDEDIIEIKHTALNRKGFALGAVKVAEWIQDKKGFLTMQDYLKLSH